MAQSNVNVNLLFQANTTAAQQNIQQLANILNQIATPKTIGVSAGPISEAATAAKQLQMHLDAAVNVNTGKIDLVKLNNSLKTSKVSLTQLVNQLQGAGAAGQQAFLKIATAINQADVPTLRFGKNISKFMKTLGNTALWTIASNGIHAIQSGMESAIRHAQDLNKAFTDIRIVTGYSQSQMAEFAKTANKAAIALNTTSTEYAKASLIFYQQGLSGKAVEDRTNVIIRMSQVTGQSAETVSDQMTAIWNNFYDGSKNLEYYADAIAKLGAATAASTDEISAGVEKFAAISDTVGLSFEYATSALATVVDKTRQSPEVIGTAFKTIFARIQGLKLGETLEDGTDLNKYSEALESVGINIKTADGQLKDMDIILDELGAKWQIMGKDAQVALAQTVGGLRQYNQMIALMDNYDAFKENVNLAESSTGELKKQAENWGESWEGAMKRIEQKKNQLFENFIDDKSVTVLAESLGEVLDIINMLIDSFGGLGPLAGTLIGLFSAKLFPLVISGIQNTVSNIGILLGFGQKKIDQTQAAIRAQQEEKIASGEVVGLQKRQLEMSMALADKKRALVEATRGATKSQREEIDNKIKLIEVMELELQKSIELQEQLEKQVSTETKNLVTGSENRRIAVDQERQNRTDKVISNMNRRSGFSKNYTDENEKNEMMGEALEGKDSIKEKQRIVDKAIANKNKIINDPNSSQQVVEQEQKILNSLQERKTKLEDILLLYEKIQKAQSIKNMPAEKLETVNFGDKTTLVESEDFERKTEQNYGKDIIQSYTSEEGEKGKVFDGVSKSKGKEGSLEVNTNIKNFKAAKQEAGKYNKMAETLTATQENLNKMTKDYSKNMKQAEGNTKKQAKITKQYQSNLQKMEKGLVAVGKEMGIQEDTLQNVTKPFGDLSKKVNIAGGDMNKLQGNLSNAGSSIKMLAGTASGMSDSFSTMADGMSGVLVNSGYTRKELDSLGQSAFSLGGSTVGASDQLDQMNEALNGSGLQAQTLGQTWSVAGQGLMTAAGSISMLFTSLNMLSTVFDENASATEKWQAGLMGFTMLVPSLINGAKGINDMLKVMNLETIKNTAAQVANTAVKIKDSVVEKARAAWGKVMALVHGQDTVATTVNTTAQVANQVARNPIWGAVVMAAVLGVTAVMIANTKKTEANTKAVEENNAAKEENAQKTKETADGLFSELEAVDDLIDSYKKLKDTYQDTADAQQQIMDKMPDLIQKYNTLKDTISLSAEEQEAFNQQMAILEGVKEGYYSPEEAEKAISELNKITMPKIADQMAESNQQNANVAQSKWAEKQGKGFKTNENGSITISIGGADSDKSGEEDATREAAKKIFGEEYVKSFGSTGSKKDGSIGFDLTLDTSTAEGYINSFDKLVELKKELETTQSADQLAQNQTYDEIVELIQEGQEGYDNIKGNKETYNTAQNYAAMEKLKEGQTYSHGIVLGTVVDSNPFFHDGYVDSSGRKLVKNTNGDGNYHWETTEKTDVEDVDSFEDYKKYKEDMIAIQAGATKNASGGWDYSGISEDKMKEVTDSVENFLATTIDETALYGKVDQKMSNFKEKNKDADMSFISDKINNMTDEELHVFLNADLTGVDEITEENFNEVMESAINPDKMNSHFNSLLDEVFSGDVTAVDIEANENYKALKESVQDLGTLYPELQDDVETFNTSALVGTEQWRDAMLNLQDAVNKIDLDRKFKDYQKASDEFFEKYKGEDGQLDLSLALQSEDFEKDLQDLLNKDYAINIEIQTQAQEAFDNFISMQDEMAQQAKNIGENYIVSAENMQELNSVFPGILEGYKKLEDGSIQLSETQVKAAMQSAKATAEEDKKALLEKLRNMKAELDSKYVIYKQMHEAAVALQQGNITLGEYESQMQIGFDELEKISSSVAAAGEIDDQQKVADSSNTNAGITAANWTSGYATAARAANEFAKVADNANKVAAGKAEGTVDFSIENDYKGKDGEKPEDAPSREKAESQMQEVKNLDLNNAEDKKKYDEFVQGQVEYWEQAMTQNRSAANEIDGMIAEAEARAWEDNVSYGNIGSGNGSNGNSDKNGKDKGDKGNEPHEESEKWKDNEIFRAINADQEIDRFEDEANAIDKVSQALDKLSREKDEAYGQGYLDLLDQENEKLKEQNKLYIKQRDEAKKFMSSDMEQAKAYGLNIQTDAEGMILNPEEIERQLIAMENATEEKHINTQNQYNIDEDAALNALRSNDDATNAQRELVEKDYEEKRRLEEQNYEQEQYNNEQARAWYENYKEAYEKYVEAGEAYEENLVQIRANNLEKIQKKTELLIEMNERELEVIDLMQSRLSDSFEDAPELFSLMSSKFTDIVDKGTQYTEDVYTAINAFREGEISQAGMMEILGNSFDGLMDSASSLVDYANEMDEAYVNAISNMSEALDTASEGFDHLISLTENYESILGLMGKSEDRDLIGGLYKQRASVTKSQYEQSTKDYEFYLQKYQQVKEASDAAAAAGNTEAVKQYENELELLKEKVHEKQETMLADAQSWLESMNAIRDNALAAAAETLEKSIFGGKTAEEFDEYVSSLQAKTEEFLTETNQQYETQKMIRTAMRDIEKTENEAAKRKLENFKKETAELQKQNQLSNFELQVQQAKYELLLAEIALQEAQDAKSTVRLRRDAEGNFNYVYTADQDKIAEAEQKYADAENKLYNIRLEGANEYAEKFSQIQQELLDKAQEIMADETLSVEEKNARVEELYEEYYARLQDMQSIYNIAAEGLGDDLNEAWTTDMMSNIASVDEFKTYFQTYIKECDTAFSEWSSNVDILSQELSEHYGDIETAVGNVTLEVEDMRDRGNIALEQSWEACQNWSEKTARDVQTVIDRYTELAQKIIEIQQIQSGFNADINYMAQYQESTTVTQAFQNLMSRDRKVQMTGDQWQETVKEIMMEVNNQHTSIDNAQSMSEALAAAARREAKLAYLQYEDFGTYQELKDNFPSTKELLQEAYKRLGRSDEEFELAWKKILDELEKLPGIYSNNKTDVVDLISENGITTLATGGYTGDFGPEGRLAFLHEKELVLNKQDTQNLLDTVDIVKDLLDSFEYNNLVNSIAGLNPISINSVGGGDFLEQEVTIHAEFPNVQDKHEIEDAIENLVLTASQFANRKS